MRLLAESKIAWVAGLALGVAAIAVGSMVPAEWAALASAAGLAVIFAVAAALGTALLKRRASTVGLMIATPLTVFLLISVLFAGNVGAFARHDALSLAGAIAGAFAGAYVGTRLFRRSDSAAQRRVHPMARQQARRP